MQLHMPNERLYGGGGSQRRRIMDADEPFLPAQHLQPKMPISPAPMPPGPMPFEGSGPSPIGPPAMMPALTPGLVGNQPTKRVRGFGQLSIMNNIHGM